MKKTYFEKELHVPEQAMMQVAEVLQEHDLSAAITGVDSEDETIEITVSYLRSQREALHQIADIIEEHSDEENEDDEDSEDDEDDEDDDR